jgi:hypothetical protein
VGTAEVTGRFLLPIVPFPCLFKQRVEGETVRGDATKGRRGEISQAGGMSLKRFEFRVKMFKSVL